MANQTSMKVNDRHSLKWYVEKITVIYVKLIIDNY